MNYRYRKNTELPAIPIVVRDNTGALVDYSTGWTFTVYICDPDTPTVALVAKTSGITGAATDPNITIAWAAADFATQAGSPLADVLDPADAGTEYPVVVIARRTADSKDEEIDADLSITLRPAITGP